MTRARKEDPPRRFSNLPLTLALGVGSVCLLACFAAYPVVAFSRVGKEASYVALAEGPLERERAARCHPSDISMTIANKALREVWSLQPDAWPDVTGRLDSLWAGTAVNNLTWQHKLHSLFILYDLMHAHRQTSDERYLDLGKRIITSWIRCNPRYRSSCRYAWYDHSAAYRAISVCAFVDYCHSAGHADSQFESAVARSLFQHGTFHASRSTYLFPHNHGISQDYALIVIATHLGAGEMREQWLRTAKGRLLEQIRRCYSENSIHLENSPGYHIGVTRHLADIIHYMDSVKVAVPPELRRTVSVAKKAVASFVMPGGEVVPVGDTRRGLTEPQRRGQAEPFTVYPGAGYGIMRGRLYGFFAATNNSFSHKHCDDLSLLVADEFGPILTDPGFLNYQPGDKRRAFTASWAGHSTVTTTSEDPQARSELCGIVSYGRAGDCMFLRGISVRGNGVVHERSVLYDRADELLLVVDDCRSAEAVTWQRFFHFGPGTRLLRQPGGNLRIPLNGKTRLSLALWPPKARRRVIVGQDNPLQGWVAEAFGRLVPAPVTEERLHGRSGLFLAAMRPEKDQIRLTVGEGGEIRIETGSYRKTVRLSPDAVQVATAALGEDAVSERVRAVSIPLRSNQPKRPYDCQRHARPLEWRERLALMGANVLGWSVVCLLVRWRRLRRTRRGLVFVSACTIINVVAFVVIWPYLNWPGV